jgi:hypothetical protein
VRYRRLFYLSLLLLVIIVGGVTLVNYIADPYGLFRRDFSYQFLEPDKLFIKTRYIANNPDKFDCLVFGSSRVNGIDVTKATDAKCYNMNYPMGLPGNHLENIRYLLKRGVKIKLLMIGLDEFSYKKDPKKYEGSPMGGPYPPVIGQRALPCYLNYLVTIYRKRTWDNMIKGYKEKGRRLPNTIGEYDHFVTGRTFNPAIERYIEDNREKHDRDPRFNARKKGLKDPGQDETRYRESTLRDLRDLVDLAKQHNIRLVLFFNPSHYTVYLRSEPRGIRAFQKELAAFTDFYDFSGVNSITTNSYYYYEPNHYRAMVGDMMIARIFGYEEPRVPADFGVLVTQSNVTDHVRRSIKQAEQYMSTGKLLTLP